MLGKEIYLVQNFSEVKTKEKFVCIFPVSKEHSNSPLNVSIILINFYESRCGPTCIINAKNIRAFQIPDYIWDCESDPRVPDTTLLFLMCTVPHSNEIQSTEM